MKPDHLPLSDYDYPLSENLIAHFPPTERGQSRLCVYRSGNISHHMFPDLLQFLNAGDCLVLNDTRVIPARFLGHRKSGGQVEVFLLRQVNDTDWIVLGKPGRAFRDHETLLFSEGVEGTVMPGRPAEGQRLIRFSERGNALFRAGHIPLPPYIKRAVSPLDSDRYQTVLAREEGAIAAPTAGLHFTETLLDEIRAKGVSVVTITLHVGLGTFRPVKCENALLHQMEKERFVLSSATCEAINRTHAKRGRVFAVGTTVARTLETAAIAGLPLTPQQGESELFIHEPYTFKVIQGLITNFHVPKSTLLMLVSALVGRENVMRLYHEAIAKEYRFLSYGDATLFIP